MFNVPDVCARTFAHAPVLCTAALEMLREELEHALQAPSDDITGISGTRSGWKQLDPVKETALLSTAGPQPSEERLIFRTHLRVSASLALGPCWVPDSSVWSRPTLFMAVEMGDATTFSWMYFLPVRGVETFRAKAWREQRDTSVISYSTLSYREAGWEERVSQRGWCVACCWRCSGSPSPHTGRVQECRSLHSHSRRWRSSHPDCR